MWSGPENLLYWVDINGRSIHRFDPTTGVDESRALAERPGSIALTPQPGRLLVALEHRLVWFDWETGGITEWVHLEESGTGNRLNDGRCDPSGRFWVGSLFIPTTARRFTGMLHRVEPEGTVATVRREVGVSNGLAFSPDGTTMYFADTAHEKIWAYDYDLESGEQAAERVFVDFSDIPGRPDGACVDADGCYWVACVYGWAVIRVTPRGIVDRRIELPVQKPTMPAFGGQDLDVLFITSIGEGGAYSGSKQQHAPGGLFAIEPGVSGIAEPLFAG